MLCWMFLSFIMPRSCSDLGGWKARNQVLLLESIQCLVNTPLQPGTRLGVKLLFRTEGNKEINLLQLVREGPIVVGGGASIVSLSLYLAMPYFLNAPNYHQVTGQLHGNQFVCGELLLNMASAWVQCDIHQHGPQLMSQNGHANFFF